jgi:hypothetical protein
LSEIKEKQSFIEALNREADTVATENVEQHCPYGGDEAEDCKGCIYSTDYHFVAGDCKRRY